MKILIQTWNEIKKLLLHPVTYLLVAVLIIGMVLTGILYKPNKQTNLTSSITGSTVEELYNSFYTPSVNVGDSKRNLDIEIENNYALIQNMQQKIAKTEIVGIKNEFQTSFMNLYRKLNDSTILKEEVITLMKTLLEKTTNFLNYIKEYKNIKILETSLLIKDNEYKSIENLLNVIISTLPTADEMEELEENNSTNRIYSYANSVVFNNYKNLESTCKTVDELSVYDLNMAEAYLLIGNYYEDVKEKLNSINEEILKVYSVGESSSTSLEKMQALINNYKIQVHYASEAVRSSLLLDMNKQFGTKSMKRYMNYSSFDKREEKQNLSLADFYLNQKDVYPQEYLSELNFGESSKKINAYDFAYNIFVVGTLILILYFIFYAFYTFANERDTGKSEFMASAPLSKNELFFSKAIALLSTIIISVFVLGMLSIIFGIIIYGIPSGSILAVTSTKVELVAPFLFYFKKVILFILMTMMWTTISVFVSNLVKNQYIALGVLGGLFLFAILGNTFLSPYTAYAVLPFAHFDLSMFMGGASLNGGFLKTCLYPGAYAWISYLYFFGLLIILNLLSYFLFRRNGLGISKKKKIKELGNNEEENIATESI